MIDSLNYRRILIDEIMRRQRSLEVDAPISPEGLQSESLKEDEPCNTDL
jgi:hypothetical protein